MKYLNSKYFLLMSCRPLFVVSWCHLLSLIEYKSEWWDYLSAPLISLPLMSATTSSNNQKVETESLETFSSGGTDVFDLTSQSSPSSEYLGLRWRLVKEVALAIQSQQMVGINV